MRLEFCKLTVQIIRSGLLFHLAATKLNYNLAGRVNLNTRNLDAGSDGALQRSGHVLLPELAHVRALSFVSIPCSCAATADGSSLRSRKVRGAVLILSQAVREICDFVEASHGHIDHDTMAGRIAELHALLRCNLPSPSKCSKQLHARCKGHY